MIKKIHIGNSDCKEKRKPLQQKQRKTTKLMFTVPGENVNTAHFIIPVSSAATNLFIHTNHSAGRRRRKARLRFQTLNQAAVSNPQQHPGLFSD